MCTECTYVRLTMPVHGCMITFGIWTQLCLKDKELEPVWFYFVTSDKSIFQNQERMLEECQYLKMKVSKLFLVSLT